MSLRNIFLNVVSKILAHFNMVIVDKEKAYIPWPTAFSTVDIAVVDIHASKILLGRKKDRWCIVGGFTDPGNASDEEDACRELKEETTLVATPKDLKYIGNFNIPDPRYEGTPNGIRTHFFIFYANHKEVTPRGCDDLDEVCWFDLKDRFELIEVEDRFINKSHNILIRALKTYLGF